MANCTIRRAIHNRNYFFEPQSKVYKIQNLFSSLDHFCYLLNSGLTVRNNDKLFQYNKNWEPLIA